MNTKICRKSGAVVCRSFKTYGKIPTDNARSTLPRDPCREIDLTKRAPEDGGIAKQNLQNNRKLFRWIFGIITAFKPHFESCELLRKERTGRKVWKGLLGGILLCAVRPGGGALLSCHSLLRLNQIGNLSKQFSTAISQASHIGCWCVGGNSGMETGVQSFTRIICPPIRSCGTNLPAINPVERVAERADEATRSTQLYP